MSDSSEYIDAYFQKQLSETERKNFEQRCIDDKAFAEEVADHISASEAVRQYLLDEKKKEWSAYNDQDERNVNGTAPVRRMNLRSWLPYAAAACLILSIVGYMFFASESPTKMANEYVDAQLTQISQTLDAASDSLEVGIAAYNNKEYEKALIRFQQYFNSHPENTDAKKYLGLSYLMLTDYDHSIAQFEELSRDTALYSNPGLFLKAVALLQRNRDGDRETAKALLEQVKAERLEGADIAEKWLRKWP